MMFSNFPNCFKLHEVCSKAVEDEPGMLQFIPDQYKTQALCEKVVDAYPLALYCVPD